MKFDDLEDDQALANMQPDMHRRFTLQTQKNPKNSIDYVISLGAVADDEETTILVHYVPDKLILNHDAFEQYLHAFCEEEIHNLEQLALTMLDDLNNELVPRWVQVQVKSKTSRHRVMVEDRQPNWVNVNLLSRIEKF